jgi:heme A synthase
VALSLVTSRSWILETPQRLADRPSKIKTWAAWTTLLIYLQIVVGAVTRHSGAGLAIPDFPLSFGQLLPSDWSPLIVLQFSHTRVGAFLVLLFVSHTAYRVCVHYPEEKELFYPAALAGILVWFQCFLGVMIIFTEKDIIPTSVHVLVGAATLAAMWVLTLNCFHILKKD